MHFGFRTIELRKLYITRIKLSNNLSKLGKFKKKNERMIILQMFTLGMKECVCDNNHGLDCSITLTAGNTSQDPNDIFFK